MLVPEANDARLHRGSCRSRRREQLDQAVAELVHVEVAGVDDDIGPGLDRLEQPTAPGSMESATPSPIDGMPAAVPFVAADQHLVGGVEEEDPDPARPASARARRPRTDAVEPVAAAAATDHQSRLARPRPGLAGQLGHLPDEREGRLSMTNQPRSSRTLGRRATVRRRTARRRPRTRSSIDQSSSHRRNSRRGMVAASWYSAALARKPGGGAGSSMRDRSRPLAAMALT